MGSFAPHSGYFFYLKYDTIITVMEETPIPGSGGFSLYLKRLEMQGFKSFADRIELNFPFGVTGIVGPNGSGKSNISDALRWVLGEQSIKTLRGAKMDDVIFIGSETRKPMGMAEVTVVFDNTDGALPLEYHEVAITRRLYRSGEGEFLINKNPVRLRDIHELLYDTGLGKEAYSVIGQGKIDAILSARAEDRRAVFEEAAGIVKYKNKKLLAMRKLADTDNNLVRVEDILREIAGQMEPMSEQAELAKRFLSLQNELQTIEINHMSAEIRRLEEDSATIEARMSEFESKIADEKRQELTYEASLAEIKLHLTQLEDEINKEQDLFLGLSSEKGRLSGDEGTISEKIRSYSERLKELESEVERIKQKSQAVSDERARVLKENEQLQLTLQAVGSAVVDGEKALHAKSLELSEAKKAEESYRERIMNAHNRIAELKNQKNSAQLQQAFQEQQIREIDERLKSMVQSEQALQTKTVTVQDAILRSNQEEKEHLSAIESYKAESKRLEDDILHKDGEIQENRQKVQRLEARLSMLEEMERGFQGYFQGVKAILSDASHERFSKYVRGIIADLIKVDNGYETAIEVALGSALQFVVMEDDAAAEAAVAFLKKSGQGRATFLPLNLVEGEKARIPADVLRTHQSKSAMDVVKYDSVFEKAIAHLLGQTLVAPDLKTAIQLSRAIGKRYRIVTTEGEIITPGGAITGGSLDKHRVGLISRRKEMETIQGEKERLNDEIQVALKAKESLQKKLIEVRQNQENAQNELHKCQLEYGALSKEIEGLMERRNQLQNEIKTLQDRASTLRQEMDEENASDQNFEQAVLQGEEELSAAEAELAIFEASLQSIESEREILQNKLAELRAEKVRIEQEAAGQNALIKGLDRQLQEAEDERIRIETETERIQNELMQANTELNRIKERLVKMDEESAGTEIRLNELRAKRDSCRTEADAIEEKIKGIHLTTAALQQQLHRVELQLNRSKMMIESHNQHLVESYGLDWDQLVLEDWTPPVNPQNRIELLRREIKSLGPVNVAAIEEYQRLQERHDFLQQQFADLKSAKETLERVITEIERTIRKRFLETFAEIRQAFIEIFNGLFTGGRADLFLVDPEDPLESGIEIMAQPPGKRLQTLSLLSGGERAMIAIALLFAILKIKPSPFCVLDEIDATLDDVNVTRFSELLKDFSKELQYIVVTHRRGTMETANALYGVTMEERGISKLISIDLQKKVG